MFVPVLSLLIHTKLTSIKSTVIYTEKTHKYFPGRGQIK